jgi:IstB-like ATP binding protein
MNLGNESLCLVSLLSRQLFRLLLLCSWTSRSKDIELLVLRQEVAILRRQVSRPRVRPEERIVLSVLQRLRLAAERMSSLVTPDTLRRWHRELIRWLSLLVSRYGRLGLLLLDELGYVQLDTRGAELFFQILTEREEKSSVAVASNLPFSEWGPVITDPRLAAAIVDRMTFRAHMIETGTESFRLRTSRRGKT